MQVQLLSDLFHVTVIVHENDLERYVHGIQDADIELQKVLFLCFIHGRVICIVKQVCPVILLLFLLASLFQLEYPVPGDLHNWDQFLDTRWKKELFPGSLPVITHDLFQCYSSPPTGLSSLVEFISSRNSLSDCLLFAFLFLRLLSSDASFLPSRRKSLPRASGQ